MIILTSKTSNRKVFFFLISKGKTKCVTLLLWVTVEPTADEVIEDTI